MLFQLLDAHRKSVSISIDDKCAERCYHSTPLSPLYPVKGTRLASPSLRLRRLHKFACHPDHSLQAALNIRVGCSP
jgi:hypothetical protein